MEENLGWNQIRGRWRRKQDRIQELEKRIRDLEEQNRFLNLNRFPLVEDQGFIPESEWADLNIQIKRGWRRLEMKIPEALTNRRERFLNKCVVGRALGNKISIPDLQAWASWFWRRHSKVIVTEIEGGGDF